MNLFITGTDTGVGKTYATALLVKALRQAGHDTAAMKPICSGERSDAEQLFEACGGTVPLNEINPIWYRTPAAPYTAAMVENRPVDFALLRDSFARLRQRHRSLIVEGVGGWMVPLAADFFVADLAAEFALPVAVVVHNRLGALNHTLLTVRDIQARGLTFAGLIFNEINPGDDVATATNAAMLEELLSMKPLLVIEPGQTALKLPAAFAG